MFSWFPEELWCHKVKRYQNKENGIRELNRENNDRNKSLCRRDHTIKTKNTHEHIDAFEHSNIWKTWWQVVSSTHIHVAWLCPHSPTSCFHLKVTWTLGVKESARDTSLHISLMWVYWHHIPKIQLYSCYSPLSRISKQILKQDCMISQTDSLVRWAPTGVSRRVLKT